jgi:uncharacterized membrane protein
LALEFLLAADILRTAISPTWTDIGQLAAIAGIRTFLNYSLAHDLRHTWREVFGKTQKKNRENRRLSAG